MKYTVELTPEEEKALLTDMTSIFEWINTAIHNKAKKCMDKIILEFSDRQPDKLTGLERAAIVREANVKSGIERNEELIPPQ